MTAPRGRDAFTLVELLIVVIILALPLFRSPDVPAAMQIYAHLFSFDGWSVGFSAQALSFLGFAILAERRSMRTEARGVKSLYFTGGLLEGTETIAFFVALCLWPALFVPLAWGFGALCFVTAAARLLLARREAYAQIPARIDTTGLTPGTVAGRLAAQLDLPARRLAAPVPGGSPRAKSS